MKIKTFLWWLSLFCGLSQNLYSQDFASYYSRNSFLMGASGSFQNGLLGFANPASTVMLKKFNLRYYWSVNDDSGDFNVNNWGLFSAFRGMGFGVQSQKLDNLRVKDYNFSLASGNRKVAFGIGYSWSTGDKSVFNREKLITLGWLVRPGPHVSVGLVGNFSTETSAKEGVIEIGLRPLATNRFTLFADYALQKDQNISDAPWSAGAALEVLPGINLTGRYFDSQAFTMGLNISFGQSNISSQGHFDDRQNHNYNSYSVGFGDYTRNVFSDLFSKKQNYLALELKGRIDYQKYRYFDDNTIRFMDILQKIQDAVNDPAVVVLALNLSAMKIFPEHAWELREALKTAQKAGKKVIVYIDNVQMTGYHLASVADKIVMDPEGSIMLPGYILKRTYLKGTLEKLGLGFDEWRFFKYKSAVEALSRNSMSPADREQRQAFVDDIYDLAKSEICQSRNFSTEKFDKIINNSVFFMGEDALHQNLVDTLSRWSDLDGMIKDLTGQRLTGVAAKIVAERTQANPDWGIPPRIAVVYALGVCAMDTGIRARWLEKVIRKLSDRNDIKALVLRVDSPGGDGMASDVVAEALKKCSKKKPVVVSQGQVAASGGYWISMYGDSILAGPGTITGSIGVIGGWIYDKGINKKLGMTWDYVKRGDHADLGAGVRLPGLGVQIPARNLTDEERSKMETFIKRFYQEFVEKVADGRKMPVDSVKKIAQGRIYSGVDGKEVGLVDRIGGLLTSLEVARKLANISPETKYEILEIPKYKGLFNNNLFGPFSVKEKIKDDPTIKFIKMMSDRPGYPLPVLLPGSYPEID